MPGLAKNFVDLRLFLSSFFQTRDRDKDFGVLSTSAHALGILVAGILDHVSSATVFTRQPMLKSQRRYLQAATQDEQALQTDPLFPDDSNVDSEMGDCSYA